MAALSVVAEPEPEVEQEPEPQRHVASAGHGVTAVVVYDYEVCQTISQFIKRSHLNLK